MESFNLIFFGALFLILLGLTVFAFLKSFMFGFICLLLTVGVGYFVRKDVLKRTKNAPGS